MEANIPIYKTRIHASQLIASAFFLTPLILGQAIAFFIDETFFWSASLLTLTCRLGLYLCVVCGNAYTEHANILTIINQRKYCLLGLLPP